MDELALVREKETIGAGKMFRGDFTGKRRRNLWRNKVEKGAVWKGGEKERGINPSRC